MYIGNRIKQVREKDFKMTQLEFAKQLNVSQSAVSGAEKGKNSPSFDFFLKIVNLKPSLKLNLNWFFYENAPKSSEDSNFRLKTSSELLVENEMLKKQVLGLEQREAYHLETIASLAKR